VTRPTPPEADHPGTADGDDGGVAVDADPTGDHAAEDTVDAPGDEEKAPRRGMVWRILPWVLVVLATAVAVISTLQLQEYRATEAARADAEAAAGTFMLTLTTWDATEGMGGVREELRAAGTDRFAGEVDELFGTTEDLAGLAEVGARSEGDVRRIFVQHVDEDTATVFVVVVQRLSSDLSDEDEVSARYAEVELLDRDGAWRVDDVELLVDASQQDTGTVSPDADPAEQEDEG
jgi:hypothetical protein